jgi:hypothetical protein
MAGRLAVAGVDCLFNQCRARVQVQRIRPLAMITLGNLLRTVLQRTSTQPKIIFSVRAVSTWALARRRRSCSLTPQAADRSSVANTHASRSCHLFDNVL